MRNPKCNSSFTQEAIIVHKNIDISIAVAVDGGLLTPVIKNPSTKGLAKLSFETKALIQKAHDGKLKPEEYNGGTFTISNLGMFGIESFNSIINAPQSGILSVGAYFQKPVVENNLIQVANILPLTLAIDHRCIDGAPAAIFLNDLKSILENPVELML